MDAVSQIMVMTITNMNLSSNHYRAVGIVFFDKIWYNLAKGVKKNE